METGFFQQIFDRYVSWVIVSLEPFYLLLQIRNLLVNRVIMNFREPLVKIERAILQIMCTFSTVLIYPITHVLAAKSNVKVIPQAAVLTTSLVGAILRIDNHIA